MMAYATRVPDEEKAERVFGVLNQTPRPRLTVTEIADRSGLSRAQVKQGWRYLRRTLGEQIAIMEPHREHTVYYLSEEFNDGARYIFWQARHLYARVRAAHHTVRDLRRITDHMPGVAAQLKSSQGNLWGAWSNIDQLLRTLHTPAGVEEGELERILAAGEPPG